ncbi:MAG TPA: hypothetical protein VLG38_01775 [Gammaproteobacteria bacterium]|nr:hypothetical protein [Gammaproteobacteria bacterium]
MHNEANQNELPLSASVFMAYMSAGAGFAVGALISLADYANAQNEHRDRDQDEQLSVPTVKGVAATTIGSAVFAGGATFVAGANTTTSLCASSFTGGFATGVNLVMYARAINQKRPLYEIAQQNQAHQEKRAGSQHTDEENQVVLKGPR